MSEYAVYAVRYGTNSQRRSVENFIGGDSHDTLMPMDFFVWAIVGGGETIVVDTGFDEKGAAQRGFTVDQPIVEGLREIGVEADSVSKVILTHMHWDHAGNHEAFPNARYHVQDREMRYCTGRCMCHQRLRRPYSVGDVNRMVERVFEGRVEFHDGVGEIAPGISVHHVGGHTSGLQIVRVRTRRGWVVLASDLAHYYTNFFERRPFPEILDIGALLEGCNTAERLATSASHIIPGHDPLVAKRYPLAGDQARNVVRLDVDPLE